MAIKTFPFSGGIRKDADIKILPDGLLSDAVNVDLDRVGRFVVRPGYTAVARTVYGDGGNLVAYDLFTIPLPSKGPVCHYRFEALNSQRESQDAST